MRTQLTEKECQVIYRAVEKAESGRQGYINQLRAAGFSYLPPRKSLLSIAFDEAVEEKAKGKLSWREYLRELKKSESE